MKFTVNKTELQRGLAIIWDILNKKQVRPDIRYIQIKAQTGSVRLTATDFTLTAHYEIEAENVTEGRALVQGLKFIKAIKSLPQIPVQISLNDDYWVKISAGRSKFCIAGIDPDVFISMPEPSPTQVQISSDVFRVLLEHTRFAAAKVLEVVQHYSTLSCVHLRVTDRRIEACSTDRQRLAYARYDGVINDDAQIAVPVPLTAIQPLLKTCALDSTTSIGYNNRMFICKTANATLIADVTQEPFPDVKMILDKHLPYFAVYDAKEFKAVIERAVIMAEGKPALTLSIKDKQTEFYAGSYIFGDSYETLNAIEQHIGSADFSITLNPFYIADCLRLNSATQTLVLRFNTPNDPVEITFNPVQNCTYRYIIAPIQVQGE